VSARVLAVFALIVTMSSTWLDDPSRAQTARQDPVPAAEIDHNAHALPAASRDETVTRIELAERELVAIAERLDELERILAGEGVAAEELEAEVTAAADETLTTAINLFRRRDQPDTLIAADELSTALRSAALGRSAVAADTDAFDDYRTLRKELDDKRMALVVLRQRLADLEATAASVDGELQTELLWLVEIEERQLQQRSAAEYTQASIASQFRGRKQGFYLATCPVNGSHEFVNSWGFARSGGRRHKGVDMLAAAGTEIVAPVAGQVKHATNSLGGRVFRLVDEAGNYYYGAHLSAFGKEGQVRAGEVIGYVGDSGNAAGINHLHFEIHPGGRGNPVNPFVDTASVCEGATN